MKKQNKTNWGKVIVWTIVYLAFVGIGFIAGMSYQQVLVTQSAIQVLEGADININLNETKITETITEFSKTFAEVILNQSINWTLHNAT